MEVYQSVEQSRAVSNGLVIFLSFIMASDNCRLWTTSEANALRIFRKGVGLGGVRRELSGAPHSPDETRKPKHCQFTSIFCEVVVIRYKPIHSAEKEAATGLYHRYIFMPYHVCNMHFKPEHKNAYAFLLGDKTNDNAVVSI